MPQRIQRRRTRGWRLPPTAIYVGRPTKWGNPFTVQKAREAGYQDPHAKAVHAYRLWLAGDPDFTSDVHRNQRLAILRDIHELRGKDLSCWCRAEQKCHADVLLEMANK